MASEKTIPRICKQCGAGFLISAYDAARARGTFCGTHCSALSFGHKGTHHKSDTREYKCYRSMLERCFSPKHRSYKNYGGRGITVCERWRGPNGFTNFVSDMGPRPAGKTLERRDNNGPYSPDNCIWATRHEQGKNKRNNVWLTLNGRTQIMTDWSTELNIDRHVINRRLRKNWSIEAVLTKGRLPKHLRHPIA